MRLLLLLVITFCLSWNDLIAQHFELGSWNILNIKFNQNQKLSFFGEAQLRSLKFYNNFHYYEYKGGFNYKVYKNVLLTVGTGSYQTYKEGGDFVLPKNNDEFRIWPQLNFSHAIGSLKLEQRYRAEFRFTQNNGYLNRYRYRLGISYPFGRARDDYKPFQISVSNEIFLRQIEPNYERNRALFALNYKPSQATTIQLGYIRQSDYKINDETGRTFFQIGYFIEVAPKKSHITAIDTDIKDN
jgi:hypothetical protein